jgi:hypothetical protein
MNNLLFSVGDTIKPNDHYMDTQYLYWAEVDKTSVLVNVTQKAVVLDIKIIVPDNPHDSPYYSQDNSNGSYFYVTMQLLSFGDKPSMIFCSRADSYLWNKFWRCAYITRSTK